MSLVQDRMSTVESVKESVKIEEQKELKPDQDDDLSEFPETTIDGITLVADSFGFFIDPVSGNISTVKRFTWSNKNDVTVQVITYGATITKILVPDVKGRLEDIVLGFDDMEGYKSKSNQHIGCTVGRVANRIGYGQFMLKGKTYEVKKNINGIHHLHGGSFGFDKKNWVAHVDGTKVRMSLLSKDGDEGYPGDLLTTVTYYLDKDNGFHTEFEAMTSKTTIVNLTNHSYFNLAGHGSGCDEVYKHLITINADRITITDKDSIPNGEFRCVGGTVFDFRVPRLLGPALARAECNGFDNNFCVIKGSQQGLTFLARALHPRSGRCLEVYSDQPGVQFYTGNSLPNPDGTVNPMETLEKKPMVKYDTVGASSDEPVSINMKANGDGDEEKILCECPSDNQMEPVNGKGGAQYLKHGAFCFEPQKYPDAINHPKEFESTILNPGEMYRHKIIFKFVTNNCTHNK